jgi:hypothetical protein
MNKRKNILSVNADSKTSKGTKYGFLTGILYLAPSDISGYNVCPMAEAAQCWLPCLYTAGRGKFSNVQQSRINKTKRFFSDRDNFMLDLIYSINTLIRKAERENLTPLVRLNGTSDIRWENIRYDGLTIFEHFPNVQFYDYTKIPNRKRIPSNYDLTFSYSGVDTYQKAVRKAKFNINLSRIAVVFSHRERIPETFHGLPVVSGDDSDVRHMDDKKVIVSLFAKGEAKKDTSGFVVQV